MNRLYHLVVALCVSVLCALPQMTAQTLTQGSFSNVNVWNAIVTSCNQHPSENTGAYNSTAKTLDPTKFRYFDLKWNRQANPQKEDYLKLTALQTIEVRSNFTSAYAFKTIDVTGHPTLKSITTTFAVTMNPYFGNNNNLLPITMGISTTDSKMKALALTSVIADNCPALEEVNLTGLSKLTRISVKNCPAIKYFSASGTAVTSIDLSDSPMLSSVVESNTKVTGLALHSCNSLKELKLCPEPNTTLKMFVLKGGPQLPAIDLSNFHGLEYVRIDVQGAVTGGTTPNGVLNEVKFGEGNTALKALYLTNSNVSELNYDAFAPTVEFMGLPNNRLAEFDASRFLSATAINIENNCVRRITRPGCPDIDRYYFTGNQITQSECYIEEGYLTPQELMPIKPTPLYSNIAFSNGNYEQRNVGKVHRYKVFDDPAMAKMVVHQDLINLKGYKQDYPANVTYMEGGHIGTLTGNEDEDPCYFYFDDDPGRNVYPVGKYTLFVPYITGKFAQPASPFNSQLNQINSYIMVTLNRDAPEVDEGLEFFLVGDFNGWQASETHRFIYEGDGRYSLDLPQTVTGCFRVVDARNLTLATLSFGGDATETQTVGDPHVQVLSDVKYKLGEDPAMHYASSPDGSDSHSIVNPKFELRYLPADGNNYLRIQGRIVTALGDSFLPQTVTVSGGHDMIHVHTVSPVRINVATPAGVEIYTGECTDIPVSPGIYVVTAGHGRFKVIVQ